MRFRIDLSKNTDLVPFNYLKNTNGYLNGILGERNDYHDNTSLYSVSFLNNGYKKGDGLDFPNGAVLYISSPDREFISTIMKRIYDDKNKEFAFGMQLENVAIDNVKIKGVNGYYRFNTSPIILKEKDQTKQLHNIYTTYHDSLKSAQMMKNTILNKANIAGFAIDPNEFDIRFNQSYTGKKIRWIKVKSISNKTSVCPIIIKTNRLEIVKFIIGVGVGHSTGSGFGHIY